MISESPNETELLWQARVDAAKKALEQAEQELGNQTDPGKLEIWVNRVAQRKADLERIMAEKDEQQIAA